MGSSCNFSGTSKGLEMLLQSLQRHTRWVINPPVSPGAATYNSPGAQGKCTIERHVGKGSVRIGRTAWIKPALVSKNRAQDLAVKADEQ